ncbi:MAG: type II secretion system major pseudopilin GspG [bacterium]|nr:type II secretion system major pseudopilin GspG [bacterium]
MSTPDLHDVRRRRSRRQRGFSLIEIMAVVVIMALLMGLVGTAVFDRINVARIQTTKVQIKTIESALAFYQMDTGRFPTSEQGLGALITRPTAGPEARNYRPGGYLSSKTLPLDAWGEAFLYQSPGNHNPEQFDIWSLGADGQPGGSDTNGDIGNWDAQAG